MNRGPEFYALGDDFEDPPVRRGHRGFGHVHRHTPELTERLCTFERSAGRGCLLVAQPQRPFRPRGLMIWDVPSGALVQAWVGQDPGPSVNYPPVPARWYMQSQTFEQVAKMLDEKKEPAAWGTWSACHPGMMIRIEISARDGSMLVDEDAERVQVIMWGHSVS